MPNLTAAVHTQLLSLENASNSKKSEQYLPVLLLKLGMPVKPTLPLNHHPNWKALVWNHKALVWNLTMVWNHRNLQKTGF